MEQEAIELLDDYQDESLCQGGYSDLLLYLEKNRVFALNAINSLGHEHFNRFFHQAVYSIIEHIGNKLVKCVKK